MRLQWPLIFSLLISNFVCHGEWPVADPNQGVEYGRCLSIAMKVGWHLGIPLLGGSLKCRQVACTVRSADDESTHRENAYAGLGIRKTPDPAKKRLVHWCLTVGARSRVTGVTGHFGEMTPLEALADFSRAARAPPRGGYHC